MWEEVGIGEGVMGFFLRLGPRGNRLQCVSHNGVERALFDKLHANLDCLQAARRGRIGLSLVESIRILQRKIVEFRSPRKI